MKWLINKNNSEVPANLSYKTVAGNYNVFSDEAPVEITNGTKPLKIIIDGYLLPIFEFAEEFINKTPFQVVADLYYKHKENIGHFIKGIFNLLIIEEDRILIINDRLGVRKFFYTKDAGNFKCSNDIELVSEKIKKTDPVSIVLFVLFNNFIAGRTHLHNISYSTASKKIVISTTITVSEYWDVNELISLKNKHTSEKEIQKKSLEITEHYLKFLNPEQHFITLTGGLDSRVLLSFLLNKKIKPHTFCYGNPLSADVLYAKEIAEKNGLQFKNPELNVSPEWFQFVSDEISKEHNPTITMHRAHRIDSMRKVTNGEKIKKSVLWGGYMGGEIIRDFFHDGIIISDFTNEWIHETNIHKRKELISSHLNKAGVNISEINIEEIFNVISAEKFSGDNVHLNKFYANFLIASSVSHAQDINLSFKFFSYPVPFFLDIDFLKLMFSSTFNFIHNKNNNWYTRIKSHGLYCKIIYSAAPELSDIFLNKHGKYTVREFMNNPTILFVIKRAIRKYSESKKETVVNFKLGKWMFDFVERNVAALISDKELSKYFNVPLIFGELKNREYQTSEKFWRKYTNLIILHKLITANE